MPRLLNDAVFLSLTGAGNTARTARGWGGRHYQSTGDCRPSAFAVCQPLHIPSSACYWQRWPHQQPFVIYSSCLATPGRPVADDASTALRQQAQITTPWRLLTSACDTKVHWILPSRSSTSVIMGIVPANCFLAEVSPALMAANLHVLTKAIGLPDDLR